MSKLIFVTGTGTDIGKTVVSAALVKAAQEQGIACSYWKPVQTGFPDSDCTTVKQLCSDAQILPTNFCYDLPASPDQAAEKEGIELHIENFTLPLEERLVVEGAGGLWVPINARHNMCDLIQQLDLPVILVSRSGLGTLNHTMLSLEYLDKRNIPCKGIILNGKEHLENRRYLEKQIPVLGWVPPLEQLNLVTFNHVIQNHFAEGLEEKLG